jgi:hypothetical protein
MKPFNPMCLTSEVKPLVEDVFPFDSEAELLRMSRQGNAPKYFRTGTQRSSPPLFRKADWLAFASARWGHLRPDLVEKMKCAFGLEGSPITVDTLKPSKKSKPKPKGKRK